MAEEKVESTPAAEEKPVAPQQAAVNAAPAEQAKPPEVKKEAAPVKIEKPTNCSVCNKSIRKKRSYYRNGKYFCTKTCWQTAKKKAEQPKEGAPAEAKPQ